ncbi:hypothetical protein MNBD_GAMMA11-1850 [hydrothermal vent metagenome]|uniref:Uncharacterized protein n=1 Tax=hydrothermal vent metagenome TaxID=652676 RepID=A0A3B0XGJ1_9ZZZZ
MNELVINNIIINRFIIHALRIPYFICCCLLASVSQAQKTITLNTAFAPPISNNTQTGYADLILTEAFRRIGYKLETIHIPAERALINANKGIDDGDLLRIAGLQKKYPNLIQVPEKIINQDFILFTKNHRGFKVNGWESVKYHSVGIITGWKILEKKFSQFGNQIEIIKSENADQLFTLLEKDRVDFICYTHWSGLELLRKKGLKNITALNAPLASPDFFTYLNKKHSAIAIELSAAIKEMKVDGSIQKKYDKIFNPLISPIRNKKN